MEESTSHFCSLGVSDALTDDSLQEIVDSYDGFSVATQTLLSDPGDLAVGAELVALVHGLCKHGLESVVRDHFLRALEVQKTLASCYTLYASTF